MKYQIVWLTFLTVLSVTQIKAQTAPTGSDNQGGVSAPAGTYFVSPNIPLVSLNAYTANATREVDDLSVPSVSEIGLNWTRYNNTRTTGGKQWFGQGANWRHSYQWDFTQITVGGVPTIQVVYPDGTTNSFTQTSPSVWTSTNAVTDVITPSGSNYILTTAALQKYVFNSSGQLTSIVDSKWQTTTLTYTNFPASAPTSAFTALTQVTEPGGRYLTITYTALETEYQYDGESHNWYIPTGSMAHCISKVTTSDGRYISYVYGEFSHYVDSGPTYYYINYLAGGTYTDSTGCAYTYIQLTTNGTPVLSNAVDARTPGVDNITYTYFTGASDALGAVKTISEGSSNTLICTVSLVGGNAQTPEVTFPDGSYFKYNVNAGGLLASVTNALGNSESFTYASGTGTWAVSLTDSNSHTTSAIWTTSGHLLSRTHPAVSPETTGPTEYWYYNTAGYLTSYVDLLGRTVSYTRDPTTNLVTEISYPDTTTESFSYNSFAEPLTHIRRNGGTETSTYGTTGLLSTFQDATQNTSHLTTIAYNSNYRVSSVTDADNNATGYQYNDVGQVTTLTHPDTTTELFTYGPKKVSSVTNELGYKWNYTYDGFDRVLTQVDPLTHTTNYTYSATTPTNSSPTLITLPGGKEVQATYAAAWGYETLSVTQGYGTSDAATTSYTYDANGNITYITDPRSNATRVSYDARNRVLWAQDPLGNTSYFNFDDNNNLTSEVTPDGTTTNMFDVMNRMTQSTNPKGQVLKRGYDSEGSLNAYTDSNNNNYSYYHDLDERQTSMNYPDSTSEGYSYDFVGNLLTYTNRDTKVLTLTYDNRNRPTGFSWNDGITPAITEGYDNASRTTSLSNANSALSYTYDNDNETLTEVQNVTGLGSKTVTYTYNTDGTLNTLTYPDSTVLTYGYNNRNQVTSITQGSTAVATYTYDAAGNRVGKNLANGVNSTLTYDTVERLISLQDITPSPTSGTLLQRFDYGYDAMSRRKYVKRNSALGDVYTYDTSGQVTNVQYNATNPDTTPTSPLQTVAYTLDSAGNRTQVVDSINGTATYAVNADNQYTTVNGHTLSYDDRGNLSHCNGWTYTYDAANCLTQASDSPSLITQAFDPLGRCVKRVENGTTTYLVYDMGWSLMSDYGSSGTQNNRYVFGAGIDEPISLTNSSNQSYYYHPDGHGSVAKLTNSSGAVVEQYSYDIYGEPTISTATGTILTSSAYGNRFMFTGREYLASMNLYDYRNRVYSAILGRFLQSDPIGHAGDAYNLNRFCGNDPVNQMDPWGKDDTNQPPQDPNVANELLLNAIGLKSVGTNDGSGNIVVGVAPLGSDSGSPSPGTAVAAFSSFGNGGGQNGRMGASADALTSPPQMTFEFTPPDPDPTIKSFAQTMGDSANFVNGAVSVGMMLSPIGDLGVAAKESVSVYQAIEGDTVVYVGITKNMAARAAAQLGQKGINIQAIPGLTGLSRADAKAVEQVLIETHGLGKNGGTLLNKINSIATTNPVYKASILRGIELLHQAHYPGF